MKHPDKINPSHFVMQESRYKKHPYKIWKAIPIFKTDNSKVKSKLQVSTSA